MFTSKSISVCPCKGRFTLLAAAMSALFVPAAAHAADDLWQNSAGGAWNTNANWSLNVPPSQSNGAVFNLGSSTGYTVTGGGPTLSLTVMTDKATIDLTGSRLLQGNDQDFTKHFWIGNGTGQNGALTLKGSPADWASSQSTAEIDDAAQIGGTGGNGQLTLDGVLYETDHSVGINVGDSTSAVGTLVADDQASITSSGNLVVNTGSSASFNNAGASCTVVVSGSLNVANSSSLGGIGRDLLVYATAPATASATLDHSSYSNGFLSVGGGQSNAMGLTTGQGMLTAQDGASISATSIQVGAAAGGNGTLIATGATTTVSSSNTSTSFLVGIGGTGSATFSSGAQLSTITSYVGGNGGNGTVKLSGTGTTWTMPNGGMKGDKAFIGVDSANVAGTGLVELDNGAAWNNTGPIPSLSIITIASTGTLKILSGSSVSTPTFVMQPGATLEIGLSGALNTLSATSTFAAAITPPIGASGELSVTSSATFNGALDISLESGFTPTSGEQFKILNFTGETGQFSSINFPAGYTFDTSALYTTGIITATSVPEPAGLGLIGTVGAALLAGRRKRDAI